MNKKKEHPWWGTNIKKIYILHQQNKNFKTPFLNVKQILIHTPQSFPEVSSKGIALGVFEEAFIGVSAQYTVR